MQVTRRSFLAGSAVALAAAARPAVAQETVLRVSIVPTIFPQLFDELVRDFEAAHPGIKVQIDGKFRDQGDQFQATLRQGMVNDLPDVTFQGFAYLEPLKERGFTVRLDERLKRDSRAKALGLEGGVTGTCMVGGELHGLGVGLSFPLVYINADLARRAGVNPDALPQDWDGILDLARKINALGGTAQGGFFQYASGGNWTWIALIESLGGRIMTPDGKIAFTGPEGKESLRIVRVLGEAGQARNDVSQDQARTVFGSGVLGVLVDSGSSLATFEKVAAGRFEIRTLPLPVRANGRVPAAGIATAMHARDAKRQEAAWAFMTYASGPKGQVLVGKLTGYMPANMIAVTRPELLGDYYKERPNYAAALATIPHNAPWFAFPGENSIKVGYEIRDHLRDLATLKRSEEETMAAIEKSVRALVPMAR